MTPLEMCHHTFKKWFGQDYDVSVLNAVLSVAAVNDLVGDAPWMLVVGGPGAAKTETVVTLEAVGATIRSSISSEGALLSATSKREKSEEATGGLLRELGDRGVLVLKDVTTILSMNRDSRAAVLAALREIYDGYWTRNVGTDGGQTLEWAGRLILVGAVTTSWDSAHAAISEMGDRFLLIRMDTTKGRTSASRMAISNTGSEQMMRRELKASVQMVFESRPEGFDAVDAREFLVPLADLVTQARTAVIKDGYGNVLDAHAPEMPTRFAKQLMQLLNGALSIGMPEDEASALTRRVAADSMPPMRLECLRDIAAHPASSVSDVVKRLDKPRTSVDRELQSLHILGLLKYVDPPIPTNSSWHYALANDEHIKVLKMFEESQAQSVRDLPVPNLGNLLGESAA